MIKRTVSLLLSLALLVNGIQPIYAADLVAIPQSVHLPTPPSSIQTRSSELSFKSIETKINNVLKSEKTQPKVAATYSGSCGTNVNWNLDTSTGKLTISGSGALSENSWKSYRDSIKTVVIKNGVTSIGNQVFSNCTGLTSVTIPYSVTSIDSYAFFGCTGLTSVTIPASVTYIGGAAFSSCTGLTSVTIPASVKTFGSTPFPYCSGLTSIIVASNNSNYQSIDGVLFNKDATTMICCPAGKTGSYTIPASVTSIDSYAFCGCTGLTSINIPNSVTSIGSGAFNACTGLTSVTIPASVKGISFEAFYKCFGLTSVTIPDSVSYIGGSAFQYCSGLTSVTYEGTSNPNHGKNIFSNTKVTHVNVPCEYKDSTFCGTDINRINCPSMRAVHLDRPYSFLRHLLSMFLLGNPTD